MKTSKLLIITFAVFALLFSACSDDFLDFKPTARETTETFYTSLENLEYTANAAYGILATRDVYDTYYIIGYHSISDDNETGGENINDWPEFQRMDQLNHTPREGMVHNYWAYNYKGLRFVNTFFTYVEKVRELELAKADNDIEKATINAKVEQLKGEMYFLRGFYHFMLMHVYGGVPVVNAEINPDDLTKRDRDDVSTVINQIKTDLSAAIPLLPVKSSLPADQIGRATKGAAQALLAKTYIYEASYAKKYSGDERFGACALRYDSALYYAEQVMTSGEYALPGEDGERFPSWRAPQGGTIGGYRWVFTVDGDNSPEGIWEVQNVQDSKNWTLTRGNELSIYTTIRFLTDGSSMGWSFNCPSKYLLDAFGNNDARETGLSSAPCDMRLDPRFQTTVGMEGDTIQTAKGWLGMDFVNLPTGTIGRKYEVSADEFWTPQVTHGNGPFNIRLLRFADVVLIAAEAALELGDEPKALQYVNRIRTRARNSGDTGYPLDLTAITFEDIVHERRLEFGCEPQRYFDLVRWGLADKYLNGIELASMGEGFKTQYVSGKHEFFPIPEVELQITEGALTQYPKW